VVLRDPPDVLQEPFVVLSVQVQVLRHVQSMLKSSFVLEVEQQTQLPDPLLLTVRDHLHQELVLDGVETQHFHVHPRVVLVHVKRRLRLRSRQTLALLEQFLIRNFLKSTFYIFPDVEVDEGFGAVKTIFLKFLHIIFSTDDVLKIVVNVDLTVLEHLRVDLVVGLDSGLDLRLL